MATTQETALCSKDGCSNPRADADNNNPWCKEHRAEYQRDYQARQLARKERHGWALGVQAMRDCICEELNRLAFSSFEGREIRDIVRQMPGPKLPE